MFEGQGRNVLENLRVEEAIEQLQACGIQNVIMLTGDSERAAKIIAAQLGISTVQANCLPEDKLHYIAAYQNEQHPVCMIGDGVNDAPALKAANVGIAMGAMGSDAAIEAADVVLMDDDPMKIAKGIQISRKCIRIVYENIVFSLGVKLTCLLLVAIGIANMWMGIFADVGVMVLAVLNAIRALRTSKN